MGKLALGLSIIIFIGAVLFLAIMTSTGMIESKDFKQLKKIVVPSSDRRFKKSKEDQIHL